MKAGAIVAASAALLVAPAAAPASVRLASPSGVPNPTCSPVPCDLETAVEAAAPGDEVIVGSGTYALTSRIDVTSAIFVHGAADQPHPLLVSTASPAIAVSANALVRRFGLVHFGAGNALVVDAGVVDQAVVRGSNAQFACHVRNARLNDSICWAAGNGGRAVGMRAATSFDYSRLRNVTAIASGAGSRALDVEGKSSSFGLIDGTNVIARGGGIDIEAEGDGTPGSGAGIVLGYSNFGTSLAAGPNTAATPPGLGYNQTDPPVFGDPANGDFHQHPDSPTIERGSGEAGLSDVDVDGEPRFQGYGIDIGADEYLLGPPPPDVNPPDTKILKGPAKRTKHRRTRFKFGSSEPAGGALMCSLDSHAYKPCKSPKRVKTGGGSHIFRVFAIDAAGNVDPTPAERSWRVKRKHKKKKKKGGGHHGGHGGGHK